MSTEPFGSDDEPEDGLRLHLDELLDQRIVAAGVAALARRNEHHLADMDPGERADAEQLWGEMVAEILVAARDELGGAPVADGPGRAVLVFRDHPDEPGQVEAEAIFTPEVQELGDGGEDEPQVVGTFAQVMAMRVAEILPTIAEEMARQADEAEEADGGDDGPRGPLSPPGA